MSSFQVSGNSLLPADRVDAVLAPFKGERSLDELKQAAAALQGAYGRAGFGGVVAYLPEQAPGNGVVAITVVEGKLSNVRVSGNQQFSEANVRASLPALGVGKTPRLTDIDTQIQIANENPAKQTQVLLQPGKQPGDVEALASVVETPVQRLSIGLDNTGNERTGDYRLSLGWQHANLFGRDHVASLQVQTSPTEWSAVKVLSGGYRVPMPAWRTVFDVYGAYSDVDGGNTATPAGNVTFNGRGRVFGGRASHYLPRLGDWDQRLALGLDSRAYLNNCQIDGLPMGACGSAGESVSVQPLSIEYTLQRGGPWAVGGSVSLNHNLQIGGGNSDSAHFEAVRDGAKARYTALRMSGFSALAVADDWQLRGRVALQWTRDALVPGEQFGIGGAASVRGYEERELAGDSGAVASIEAVAPELAGFVNLPTASLRVLGFVDGGYVHNQRGTFCRINPAGSAQVGRDSCSIVSLGVGSRFQLGGLQARLYIAYALKAAASTARHDTRTHFAVSYSF